MTTRQPDMWISMRQVYTACKYGHKYNMKVSLSTCYAFTQVVKFAPSGGASRVSAQRGELVAPRHWVVSF